jgi:hypothetical protein
MLKAVMRWILVLGALIAVGPLAATLLYNLRDADGGHAVTFLVNGNLSNGLAAGVVLLAAAAVVGLVGSHFLSLNTGLLAAGLVLAMGRWREGTLEELVRRAGGGKDLTMLAVEGAVVTLVAAGLTWLMVKVAHRAQQPLADPTSPQARVPVEARSGALLTGAGEGKPLPVLMAALVAGVAAAGVVAWLLSVSGNRGQTFAAAIFAAIAAGSAAQVMASSRGFHVTPVTPMLSMAVLALAGPIVAAQMHGSGLMAAVYAGSVFSLARPISLDWAAGALLGVPIGLGWAGSMLDRRHHQ